MVRLTDRPDMILDVYRGHKTTIQQPFEDKTCEIKVFSPSVMEQSGATRFLRQLLCRSEHNFYEIINNSRFRRKPNFISTL